MQNQDPLRAVSFTFHYGIICHTSVDPLSLADHKQPRHKFQLSRITWRRTIDRPTRNLLLQNPQIASREERSVPPIPRFWRVFLMYRKLSVTMLNRWVVSSSGGWVSSSVIWNEWDCMARSWVVWIKISFGNVSWDNVTPRFLIARRHGNLKGTLRVQNTRKRFICILEKIMRDFSEIYYSNGELCGYMKN